MLIIALGVVAYQLWQRVTALEAQQQGNRDLDWLEQRLARVEAQLQAGQPGETAVATPKTVAMPEPAPEPTPDPAPSLCAPRPAMARKAEPEPGAVLEEVALPPMSFASRLGFDFEDLFGRLLPIWAGGITLAVAGFFIVRYSIDAGLLTPEVRVFLGFAFGLGLLAAAEAAYRFEERVADPRVRQALAGAGIATLYASFYLAGTMYGLIGPLAAFIGLAAVTAAAIALSFRFGMPSAVLGLVGGFAAPLLVGGDEANVPLLTTYLALVTGGLMVTSRHRRWAWMGLAALGGGLGWGLLLLGMDGSPGDTLAVGLFLLVLGVALPLWAMPDMGRHKWLVESIAAAIAAIQLAALINAAGHSLLSWGLFLLLAAALALLGWRNEPLRRASGFASLLVPLMLYDWQEPQASTFALVAGSFAAILAGVPLALAWTARHNRFDLAQLCVVVLGLFAATAWQFGAFDDTVQWGVGLAALVLALFPAAALWRLWPATGERASPEALALALTAWALLLAGGLYLTPAWAAPLVAGSLGAGMLLLVRDRRDDGLQGMAWIGASAVFVLHILTGDALVEFGRLAGFEAGTGDVFAVLRWAAVAAFFAGLSWREHRRGWTRVAEVLAAWFAYGLAAQVLPSEPLAWLAAVAAMACALALRERRAAQVAFAVIAGLWALAPGVEWLMGAFPGLAGDPVLATRLPGVRETALYLLPFPAALAVLLWANADRLDKVKEGLPLLPALAMVVPVHIVFKQVFGLADFADFTSLGLAERTVWQVLLAGLAFAAWSLRQRFAAEAPFAAALAMLAALHWLVFTLLLHNPLFDAQAVGPAPVANLLLPAYGLPIAALLWWRAKLGPAAARPALLIDAAVMLLVTLLAISLLRQVFSGSLLRAVPMGQTEDLLRSLTGIVLAIGFLWWGAKQGLRNWRLGSLVLMLLAVLKVFLVDAADLEGLARIASFVALGFSLIGIGWFYSRQLKAAAPPAITPGS
nr:DUF2339 domain-containing protein [Altererythrobacter sp. KTW20L]